jgi:hypothetical protein
MDVVRKLLIHRNKIGAFLQRPRRIALPGAASISTYWDKANERQRG